MTPGDPPQRIGTAERNAAMAALDEHLAAGRLDVEEYAERSAVAANATTVPEVAALFTDLPAPHPELPGVVAAVPTTPLPAVPGTGAVPSRTGALLQGWGPQGWGPQLVAVMPFVAVALFLLTRQWVFFLLIPAAGALVYGGGLGRDDSRR